jgi:hypothetical protein
VHDNVYSVVRHLVFWLGLSVETLDPGVFISRILRALETQLQLIVTTQKRPDNSRQAVVGLVFEQVF